jgi:hypothetical protein
MTDHEHTWGPVELSRMAGTPHRACTSCRYVTLDLVSEPRRDPDDPPEAQSAELVRKDMTGER